MTYREWVTLYYALSLAGNLITSHPHGYQRVSENGFPAWKFHCSPSHDQQQVSGTTLLYAARQSHFLHDQQFVSDSTALFLPGSLILSHP